jgi:hypothetical protein
LALGKNQLRIERAIVFFQMRANGAIAQVGGRQLRSQDSF